MVSCGVWGERFFGLGIRWIPSIVRSSWVQFGKVRAMRSVRKGRRELGWTVPGTSLMQILLHLEWSSRSNTLLERRETSSSRAEWESMRALWEFAYSCIFFSTCSVLETKDWRYALNSVNMLLKSTWRCWRKMLKSFVNEGSYSIDSGIEEELGDTEVTETF